MGVLLQSGKHGGAVKIVPQLPGGDGLRAVGGEIGKPSPALTDGHALLQQLPGKIIKGNSRGQSGSDSLPQLLLIGFKLCVYQWLAVLQPFFVLPVDGKLSLFPRPILALGDAVCAAVQKVDLVKPGIVAQLHLSFLFFCKRPAAVCCTAP